MTRISVLAGASRVFSYARHRLLLWLCQFGLQGGDGFLRCFLTAKAVNKNRC
jgi:hypothetical protein